MTSPMLIVAGTDTGVGKTQVATALCRALVQDGLRVGVFKPVETGCDPEASDALALRRASGCEAPLEIICPYRLRDPLAPAVAAQRQGVTVEISRLEECVAELVATHDIVICEGAGGLLVPLTDDALNLDWFASVAAPVLLVGRLGLGTINHTLLSARCLRDRCVCLLGTVLSATEAGAGLAQATNAAVLARHPEVGLLGVMDHARDAELPVAVLAAARELVSGAAAGGRRPLFRRPPANAA